MPTQSARRYGVLVLILFSTGCMRARSHQDLPVSVRPELTSRRLQWSDPAGRLRGEVPWVLRSDLRGPQTWLLADPSDGGEPQCAHAVRFRVLAQEKIDYRVAVRSDMAGALSWSIGFDDGRTITLWSCIPRPSKDRRACLRGGVPKPLMEPLEGALEAQFVGNDDFVPVDAIRFANAPECARAEG